MSVDNRAPGSITKSEWETGEKANKAQFDISGLDYEIKPYPYAEEEAKAAEQAEKIEAKNAAAAEKAEAKAEAEAEKAEAKAQAEAGKK